jgi:acetyl esterase/lipase
MRTVRVRYSTAEGTHAWWNSLDLFGADEQGGPLKPVILFVGGGGWQGLDHVNEHQKIAAEVCRCGFVCAIVRHRPARVRLDGLLPLLTLLLLPLPLGWGTLVGLLLAVLLLLPLIDRWRAAAPLPAVILDVAHAVACVLRLEEDGPCAMVGGDARRVILCGNSSGGHLLSLVTLDGRWLGSLGAPTERIRACIDMSGVHSFAMLPLPMRCAFAALLGLDLPQWASLSPMHHASAPSLGVGCPFLLATAARELPGIRAASAALATRLASAGLPIASLTVPGCNHFTLVRQMAPVLLALSSLVPSLRDLSHLAPAAAPAAATPAAAPSSAAAAATPAAAPSLAAAAATPAAAPSLAAAAATPAAAPSLAAAAERVAEVASEQWVATGRLATHAMHPMHRADQVFFLAGFTVSFP